MGDDLEPGTDRYNRSAPTLSEVHKGWGGEMVYALRGEGITVLMLWRGGEKCLDSVACRCFIRINEDQPVCLYSSNL